MYAIGFIAWGFQSIASELGQLEASRSAAKRVFEILDAPSKIHCELERSAPPEDSIRTTEVSQSGIDFINISFVYPLRKDHQIYSNLSLKIPLGATVALVGASGSGKSTVVQLLERFYDRSGGSILMNNKPIDRYPLRQLRSFISLVSQEPNLFRT